MAKTKKVSLPPELAEPIQSKVAIAAASIAANPGPLTEEALLDWLLGEQSRKILLLLKHYRLDRRDPLAFHHLAFALAADYVPGFQLAVAKKSKPRLTKSQRALLAAWEATVARLRTSGLETPEDRLTFAETSMVDFLPSDRKPGRPRSWIWAGQEHELLLVFMAGKELLAARRQRVTNQEALFAIYRQHLPRAKYADWRLRRWAREDAKRLSDARKALRIFHKK